eukprot:944261_1
MLILQLISFSVSGTIQIAIALLFYYLQDELVSDPNALFNWISSPSQHMVRKYLLAFCIISPLSTLSIKIMHNFSSNSTTDIFSHAARHCFIIVAIAWVIHFVDSTSPVSSAFTYLVLSFGVLKQWTNYFNILHLNAIFTNTNHSKISDYKWHKITLFVSILLLNSAVIAYCFIVLDAHDHVFSFRFATYIWWLCMCTITSIPYHILPSPKYKYDLYDYQLDMVIVQFFINFLLAWQLLWIWGLQYHLPAAFCHAIYLLFLTCEISTFMASQCWEWWKQRRLAQTVGTESMLWCEYIVHDNNFSHFLDFLMSICCAECMLFVIDIVQYKNKLKHVLSSMEDTNQCEVIEIDIEYGFVLGFEPNHILPTSTIVNNLMPNELRGIAYRVYSDVDEFVAKYFDDGETSEGFNVPFISCKDKKIIATKIAHEFELKRNNMLNDDDCIRFLHEIIVLFDKQLIEINAVLQLLYREYQLDVY